MRKATIAILGMALLLGACATGGANTTTTGDVNPGTAARDADAAEFGNYLSARFAASQHNLRDAAQYYRASLNADPQNQQLLALAFFFTTSSGDIDTAAKLAQQVVALTPGDRAARLTLAVAALKHKDYAEVRKQIGLSEKGPFTSLTIGLIDGWAAAGTGDKAAAIADLASLRAQGGADALSMFHLALLADYLGDTQVAETSYKTVLAGGGASPRIVDAYGRFLERQGRKDDAVALYTRMQAEPGLKQIADTGLERVKSGKRPDALVTSPADGAAEALFGIAASLTDDASADVSILYMRLALYLRPGLDLGAVLLADRLENLQKYEDAIAVYTTIDKKSPYWRMAAVEIALDEARLGNNAKAEEQLKALTAANPQDVEAWTALGDTYRSESKFAEAAEAYNHAVDLLGTADKASNWPLYFARAVSEEGSKNWSAAELDLKRALQLAPNEPTLLNYLGYSWVDQNRNIPEALAMLEKAHTLKPTDGYIADSVGWAYYKVGRYADAARTLEKAVELVPGDPTINDHLGDAYWRVGRRREAEFQWNHALAFGPSDADKAVIEKKLKDGLDAGAKPN
ncbi:MAG: tetratricopeptide repeat protein [Alphaproteobacteria bacterium]|nr:tetratricopeptide repeat protein [Alphaproteobacteria bacterium]